jgi:dTMP kinase
VFASEIGGPTAVGTVMIARVLPGFIVGPLAGVIADRWDRRRTMVMADIIRAGVIFTLPFIPHLPYLLIASVVLESLTLVWGPAKDASLPNFVPMSQLTNANSLSLMAVYGPWPIASIIYAFMATLGAFLGANVPVLEGLQESPESLALWLDSLTFVFSAVMISTLSIPSSRRRETRLDFGEIKRDLMEGLSFVGKHKQVRPWLLGIAFTFTAAGAVFSLGIDFSKFVLEAGDRAFSFIIGFLGTGMIIGLLVVGLIAKRIKKDVMFSASLLLLGVGLFAFASMSSLEAAIPIASALGFFGGIAYSTGYSLMHEATEDSLRGRTFSAAYTVIRIGTLVGLGLFPFLARAIGDHKITFGDTLINLPGSRSVLMLAGLVAFGGGLLSMRALGARLAGGDGARGPRARGYFVVFEGGEGAGKTTQMAALVNWLGARGEQVVTTREPGGTAIGRRVREVLLDPANEAMDDRTEALLYAADRAQHVAEVIRPALNSGKIVVSDRFVDSSLAYQGLGRGLGLDRIYELSQWATGGIMPDLVFFMRLDPEEGLRRKGGDPDRMEREESDFHERVASAYLELARRWPERFVVLDASRSQAEVHNAIVAAIEDRAAEGVAPLAAARELGAPGPPVPR